MLCVVGFVRGVTQLDNIVYAVSEQSSVIKMFTADTLSPVGEGIHVKGMEYPYDIVVCRDDRQLYVADSPSCIWQVSADDHSYFKWLSTESTTEKFRADRLSVTSGSLLVTSMDSARLHQYNTKDRRLRVVSMPGYMEMLWHGIETTRGTFVVCHRGTAHDEQQCAVSDPF